ncbi:hypothetical protein QQS21_000048 [Conoideocrella luteorostrata]|uniref:Uncharacterized protein n=1 Tax=Conoideocrella luteorostrata TaxID=1105319 RepID=A0AAJ0CZI1_9HYPO|nr:hypothetical protein QQS21_000048 [Conoideocrella luteorostrata]
MKFSASIIAIATAFFATAEACQCHKGTGLDTGATFDCCYSAGGKPTGDQCPAGTISERLSDFASCCRSRGAYSDCNCSQGCNKALDAMRESKGEAGLTDAEVQAVIAQYSV